MTTPCDTSPPLRAAPRFKHRAGRSRRRGQLLHADTRSPTLGAWLLLGLLGGVAACDCGPRTCVDDGQCARGAGCLRGQCQAHDAPLLPASVRSAQAGDTLARIAPPSWEVTATGFALSLGDRLAAEPTVVTTDNDKDKDGDSDDAPGRATLAGGWLLTVNGQLHHIDAEGRPRASGQLPGAGPWLAAPTACGGRLYAVSSAGVLVGIESNASGAAGDLGLALHLDLGEGTLYPPVCWRGQLLVNTDVLYALSPAGEVRWLTVLEGRPRSAPVPWGTGDVAIATSTGEVWRVADGGQVTQRLRLRAVSEGQLAAGPGDALAIADASGGLSVFEADGALRFSAALSGPAAGGPLWLKDSGLLASDRKGRVTGFAATGAELGRWQRGVRLTGPGMALGEYAVLSGTDRALYVFDAAAKNRDLGPLDEAVVGLAPWRVAGDSSAADVFLMALASGYVATLNLSPQGTLHH